MTPELAEAIEKAYRVFVGYDLRGGVTVCRCDACVSPEIERELNTVPLRVMPSLLLAEYTHSAHTMDGKTENDFRHYLPRYFELITLDEPPTTISEECCLRRLHDAGYRANWKPSEVAAVDGFFLALFRERISRTFEIDPTGWTDDTAGRAEETLCMVAYAGGDLAPLLAAWAADTGRTATLYMANVVAVANWKKTRLRNAFWFGGHRPDVEAAMGEVIAWLLRPEIQTRLEAACLGEADEGAAALLSQAEGLVAGLT
jgi:hypothetical protein